MHGVDAIHRLNSQRHAEAVSAAAAKAEQAAKQGHPQAEKFAAEAKALAAQH